MEENRKSLRVAMLGHKRIPTREGGIEVVVEELAVRMARLGHHVTCYNRSGRPLGGAFSGGRTKSREYQGVRIRTAPAVPYRGLAAVTASVSGAFRAAFGRYDAVHFHAEGPAFMCWLPKLTGKRVVVTIHGLDHQRAKWGRFASAYILAGEKNAVRYADAIIVLSKSMQDYFRDTYGRQTHFIANGVNRPARREASLLKRLGLEKDGYLLFLGRLVPEKGIRYLIEAFHAVHTGKKLVIAGGSSDSDGFLRELQARAKADGRIVFTGFVEGELLEELYSNAYLYCLPSDLEGMPLSLLEALSYGNCCVVSDIPECAEVVGDRAAVFHRGDAEDLRRILQQLCDDPGRVERYREGASDFICGKYSWEEAVKRTLALYS